jgi:hypothetical protein
MSDINILLNKDVGGKYESMNNCFFILKSIVLLIWFSGIILFLVILLFLLKKYPDIKTLYLATGLISFILWNLVCLLILHKIKKKIIIDVKIKKIIDSFTYDKIMHIYNNKTPSELNTKDLIVLLINSNKENIKIISHCENIIYENIDIF